jgi:hypothetical protein
MEISQEYKLQQQKFSPYASARWHLRQNLLSIIWKKISIAKKSSYPTASKNSTRLELPLQ